MKKLMCFLTVLVLLWMLSMSAFAAQVIVRLSITGGECTVSVTQNGVALPGDIASGYIADSANGLIEVSAVPTPGSYVSIMGNSTVTRQSFDISSAPSELTVSIAVAKLDAPIVQLVPNNEIGGLNYAVSASSVPSVIYDIVIMDAFGNQLDAMSVPAPTGSIALSDKIVAGGDYTAKASIRTASGESGYGVPSAITKAAPAPERSYFVDVKAENGKVNFKTGSYKSGEQLTISANADNGYRLKEWTASAGSFADSKKESTVFTTGEADTLITPIFEKVYDLTLKSETGGRVETKNAKLAEGEQIKLKATPNKNFVVSGWLTSAGGSFDDAFSATPTFTMPACDVVLTAVFATEKELADTHELTVIAGEGGFVTTNQNHIAAGTQATLRATAKDGYRFSGWSSANGGEFDNSLSDVVVFTMPDNDVTVSASFEYTGESSQSSTEPQTYEPSQPADDGAKKGSLLLYIFGGVMVLALAGAAAALFLEKPRAVLRRLASRKRKK